MNFIEKFFEKVETTFPYFLLKINKIWIRTTNKLNTLRKNYSLFNTLCLGLSSSIELLVTFGKYIVKNVLYSYYEPEYGSWISTHSYNSIKGYQEKYVPISILWSNFTNPNPNGNLYLENIKTGIIKIGQTIDKNDLLIMKLDTNYYSYIKTDNSNDFFQVKMETQNFDEPCSFHFIQIEFESSGYNIEIELDELWFQCGNDILSKTFMYRYFNYQSIFNHMIIDSNYEIQFKFDMLNYKIKIVDHNGCLIELEKNQFIRLNKEDYEVITLQ
jgi:hypothetical protein